MGEGKDDEGEMRILDEENPGRREKARAAESDGRAMTTLDSPGSPGSRLSLENRSTVQ